MRIGILGTLSKPISKEATGGTEKFCALLAEGLATKGHDVFLFANSESHVHPSITIIPVAPKTRETIQREYKEQHNEDLTDAARFAIDMSHNARMCIIAKSYEKSLDIFHDNTAQFMCAASSDLFHIPIVTTMHMPSDGTNKFFSIPPLITHPTNMYVPISHYQKLHSQVETDVIYNGIDVSIHTYSEIGGTAVLWIGRISPNAPKGLPELLQVIKKYPKKLRIAGNVTDASYFTTTIHPLLDQVESEFIGLVSTNSKKTKFFQSGYVAVFPIQWEEPFGFVFVEAMACGTPVIAYARGAVPEIIEDGVTGFIVNPGDEDKRGDFLIKSTGEAGIIDAIKRIYALPKTEYMCMRQACRKRVEQLFTVENMVDNYIALYSRLLSR